MCLKENTLFYWNAQVFTLHHGKYCGSIFVNFFGEFFFQEFANC